MPRNASGTYSLPEPPFVTQTTISSTVMNSQLSDIASALTTSVASTGVTALTGSLKGIVGATVAYGFDGDATTGWGSDVAGQGYFDSVGTEIVRITGTGVTINGTLAFTGGFSGTVTTSGATSQFIAFEGISTEAAGAVGPSFSAYRNSATPAIGDAIGSFDYYGKDSAGNKTLYARAVGFINDPVDGSEDANWAQQLVVANVLVNRIVATEVGVDITGLLTSSVGIKIAANPTSIPGKPPTYQVFTSGVGATYTPTSGAVWIRVRAVGGGGGGSGLSAGSAGVATSFNSVVANPGQLGGSQGGGGGAGGAGGTGGTGTANLRLPGSQGGPGLSVAGGDVSAGGGGIGGDTPFGGSGMSPSTPPVNSGAGGGGGTGSAGGINGGGGGGGGEYFELILSAAAYIYTVGTGGAAGTNATAGAAGRIIVEEHYS